MQADDNPLSGRTVGPPPLLYMRGISKRFPGVVALDNVSLEVGRGEVVALCGENGAGKSTLMKILGGVYQPDSGEILLDQRPVVIRHVNDAMRLGIALIHQELNVLDNLDVAANVFLGREPRNRLLGLINQRKLHADTAPLLRRLGLEISTRTRLDKLPIAQQQMVEIAKALSQNAGLIIMDEPTSSLTLQETDRLLSLIVELRNQGVSVVYISHRLGEVGRVANRVVVLRDGRNAGQLSGDEISHERIVRLMVGRDIHSFYAESHAAKTPGFLQVRQARSSRYPGHAVSFDAAQGEILGFAGLVGAGRSEIAQAMVGLDSGGSAELSLGGRRVEIRRPRDAISQGIYLVPEDRRAAGLVTGMSVRENISLASLRKYATWCLISRQRERKTADEQIAALRIKTPSAETLVMNLSGGTQQKVVLGKWLAMSPRVMIFDEPTRGIDVGSKAEIHRLMRTLADQGAVILMISSDMEEILHVSDRVAVMHEGRISGVLNRPDCTEENIMNLAVGRTVPGALEV
jgi:ribose transport system ATP-binding protein